MISITGIGEGKNILGELLEKNGEKVEIISYNKFPKNDKNIRFIVYDGIMIQEALNFLESHEKCNIIFLTPKYIYLAGDYKFNKGSNYVCPRCILKRSKDNIFNLTLYSTLFSRTDYKIVDNTFLYELNHFILILKENLYNLEGSFIQYNLLTSLYSRSYFSGLTNCKDCDKHEYSQKNMKKTLWEELNDK